MRKTWLVMRYEIQTNLARRSFIFFSFVLPLLILAAVVVVTLIKRPAASSGGTTNPTPKPTPTPTQLLVEGYVDHSGLISTLPEDVAAQLISYPDEARAQEALQAGHIKAYYVIPAEYLQSGDLLYVNPDFRALSPEGQSWIMRWALQYNLLQGDVALARFLAEPMDLHVTALTTEQERSLNDGAQIWVPYVATFILYIMIIMSGSLLRSSTGNERQNRLLEILMTSLPPLDLLNGKLVALGMLGVLQTAMWTGIGYAVLRLGGSILTLPAGAIPPASILLWVIVFFILGYAVYASLLAGLGALTGPNQPGSGSADIVIVWPLIIPVAMQTVFMLRPHSLLATVLSLFPLTAPISMITRLVTGGVPWWQPFLAAGLLLITAIWIVRAVARVFRAQMLLTGEPFTLRRYMTVLFGKN